MDKTWTKTFLCEAILIMFRFTAKSCVICPGKSCSSISFDHVYIDRKFHVFMKGHKENPGNMKSSDC